MTRLSAVLCVHNEERRLARCLDALGFVDEIVLVLDRCTDRTRAIGEAYGAVMVSGVFPLEGPRRAAGMNAATGDWILEIDADEIVSPELAREIRPLLEDTQFAFRKVPVDNYVGDRLIRHGWGGAFGTSLAARLYRRGLKRWGEERVHPGVVFDGPEGPKLASPLRHQFADSVSDVFRRLDRYTDLKAQDLREHGGKTDVADNAWVAGAAFASSSASSQMPRDRRRTRPSSFAVTGPVLSRRRASDACSTLPKASSAGLFATIAPSR